MAGLSIQGTLLLELEAGLAGDEVRGKMEREEECDERGEERDPVGKFGAIGQERDEDCACERNQQDEGENDGIECAHSQCLNPAMANGEAAMSSSSRSSTKSRKAAAPSSQPRRVGAQIAGLPALEDRFRRGWRCRRAARRRRRECSVDYPPRTYFEKCEERLDDDCAVDFVDVVLVGEQLVASRDRRRRVGPGAFGSCAGKVLVGNVASLQGHENGEQM